MHNSIECQCGAKTFCGNIGKEDTPVLFVGGSVKGGLTKTSLETPNEAKIRCLWCGNKWPKNIADALSIGVP